MTQYRFPLYAPQQNILESSWAWRIFKPQTTYRTQIVGNYDSSGISLTILTVDGVDLISVDVNLSDASATIFQNELIAEIESVISSDDILTVNVTDSGANEFTIDIEIISFSENVYENITLNFLDSGSGSVLGTFTEVSDNLELYPKDKALFATDTISNLITLIQNYNQFSSEEIAKLENELTVAPKNSNIYFFVQDPIFYLEVETNQPTFNDDFPVYDSQDGLTVTFTGTIPVADGSSNITWKSIPFKELNAAVQNKASIFAAYLETFFDFPAQNQVFEIDAVNSWNITEFTVESWGNSALYDVIFCEPIEQTVSTTFLVDRNPTIGEDSQILKELTIVTSDPIPSPGSYDYVKVEVEFNGESYFGVAQHESTTQLNITYNKTNKELLNKIFDTYKIYNSNTGAYELPSANLNNKFLITIREY